VNVAAILDYEHHSLLFLGEIGVRAGRAVKHQWQARQLIDGGV